MEPSEKSNLRPNRISGAILRSFTYNSTSQGNDMSAKISLGSIEEITYEDQMVKIPMVWAEMDISPETFNMLISMDPELKNKIDDAMSTLLKTAERIIFLDEGKYGGLDIDAILGNEIDSADFGEEEPGGSD